MSWAEFGAVLIASSSSLRIPSPSSSPFGFVVSGSIWYACQRWSGMPSPLESMFSGVSATASAIAASSPAVEPVPEREPRSGAPEPGPPVSRPAVSTGSTRAGAAPVGAVGAKRQRARAGGGSGLGRTRAGRRSGSARSVGEPDGEDIGAVARGGPAAPVSDGREQRAADEDGGDEAGRDAGGEAQIVRVRAASSELCTTVAVSVRHLLSPWSTGPIGKF